MKTLRKVHKGSESGCCECYMLCGLFKILFGYSCCQCFKVSDGSEKKTKENAKETAEKWENLCSNEIIPIAQRDLDKMVKKYVRYRYSHKHYCFRKRGERCSHYKTTKWERLLQHPVLYLLKLNFAEAKKNIDVEESQNKKMYPLKFIFQEGFQDKHKKLKVFENIEESLGSKTKKICLVIENVPRGNYGEFQDKEKSLAEMILQIHSFYDVPLIYNVR